VLSSDPPRGGEQQPRKQPSRAASVLPERRWPSREPPIALKTPFPRGAEPKPPGRAAGRCGTRPPKGCAAERGGTGLRPPPEPRPTARPAGSNRLRRPTAKPRPQSQAGRKSGTRGTRSTGIPRPRRDRSPRSSPPHQSSSAPRRRGPPRGDPARPRGGHLGVPTGTSAHPTPAHGGCRQTPPGREARPRYPSSSPRHTHTPRAGTESPHAPWDPAGPPGHRFPPLPPGGGARPAHL